MDHDEDDAEFVAQLGEVVFRATRHAGREGIALDELERIRDYVDALRVSAALYRAILDGTVVVRWPEGSPTEQLFAGDAGAVSLPT